MESIHRSHVFRFCMQFVYPFVVIGVTATSGYIGYMAWPQMVFATKEAEEQFLTLIVWTPLIFLIASTFAWLVILRHYRRLDEMREYMEAAGGQVFIDSVIAEKASTLTKLTDEDEMEILKRHIRKLSNWARRLGYQVYQNPFAYLPTYEGRSR